MVEQDSYLNVMTYGVVELKEAHAKIKKNKYSSKHL